METVQPCNVMLKNKAFPYLSKRKRFPYLSNFKNNNGFIVAEEQVILWSIQYLN